MDKKNIVALPERISTCALQPVCAGAEKCITHEFASVNWLGVRFFMFYVCSGNPKSKICVVANS